ELGRTRAARNIPKISEASSHFVLPQYGVYVDCDAFAQRHVKVFRSEKAKATGNGELWIALFRGSRNLRHARRPALARNSQKLHLASAHLAEQNWKGHDRNLNAAFNQVRDGSDRI